jgi:hypothetical protein
MVLAIHSMLRVVYSFHMRDPGNIPRNTPLLSTYKRRTSPPSFQQHTKARATPQEHHSKWSRPYLASRLGLGEM